MVVPRKPPLGLSSLLFINLISSGLESSTNDLLSPKSITLKDVWVDDRPVLGRECEC